MQTVSALRQYKETDVSQRSVADLVWDFVEKNEFAVLGFLLILVAVRSLLHSYHKQFWYDEIFTIIVSGQPDLHHFFAAMPPEGNPPLNTFLTRLVINVLGISQLSVRLVPLLGFLTALSGVYLFVKREAGRVFGIFAVALTSLGPVWEYSYEARPYALLLGSFMVALVGWQEATLIKDEPQDRTRVPAFICLALGILGCMFSHYIGLIEIGIPLLVGEAVRIYVRRRVDWPLLITGLCCLPWVLLILPMMRNTGNVVIAKSTVLQPPITLEKVHAYFKFAADSWPQVMDNYVIGLVLLVALVTWVPFARKRSSTHDHSKSVGGVRTYVLWACATASLLIPITWVAMVFGKGWYFCRYGVASALGIVLWFCLLLAKRRLRLPVLVSAVILAATLLSLLDFERALRAGTPTLPGAEMVEAQTSNLPLVISNPFYYPTIWWYAPDAKKPQVVYLKPPGSASMDLVTATLMAEKSYFHAPMQEFDDFIRQTPHFLLELDESSVGGPFDRTKELERQGFVLTPIQSRFGTKLFDVDRAPLAGK